MRIQYTGVSHSMIAGTSEEDKRLFEFVARDGAHALEIGRLVLHEMDCRFILLEGRPRPLEADVKIFGEHLFVEWVRQLLGYCPARIRVSAGNGDGFNYWVDAQKKLGDYVDWLEQTK